jgi:hypothetical protein
MACGAKVYVPSVPVDARSLRVTASHLQLHPCDDYCSGGTSELSGTAVLATFIIIDRKA